MRDLASYNALAEERAATGRRMPQVVIVIDELADLMLVRRQRGGGEHLPRGADGPRRGHAPDHRNAAPVRGRHHRPDEGEHPEPHCLCGLVLARESRIILDTSGAEKLIGMGDMLYAPIGTGKPLRVQGCVRVGRGARGGRALHQAELRRRSTATISSRRSKKPPPRPTRTSGARAPRRTSPAEERL